MTSKIKHISKFRKLLKTIGYFFVRLYYRIKSFNWVNIILISLSGGVAYLVYKQLKSNTTFDTQVTLTNLLTINGVFSAILITYLFTRITWSKDRKLEYYNEAISLSQKITEFRRILDKLTNYYNVWSSDDATKNLLDHTRFKHIDFYDFRLASISDYKPKDYKLIEELKEHKNFSEGISNLYLAMVSLVKDKKRDWYWQQELYKDFEYKGIYNLEAIQRWIDSDVFGTIWYWLQYDANQIKYYNLTRDKDYILAAATRINKKYQGYELENKLIKELADDLNNHYLGELHSCLTVLKKGVQDLSLLILVLICISLFFGVLIPFILLILDKTQLWYSITVEITAAINAGLITFFILKFPFLINKELKWV